MKRVNDILRGLVLVAIAVCLVLWKLGKLTLRFSIAGVSWFWVIVAIGLAIVAVTSLCELNFGGVFFPAAFICMIFAKPWHLEALTPWVVLVVAVGRGLAGREAQHRVAVAARLVFIGQAHDRRLRALRIAPGDSFPKPLSAAKERESNLFIVIQFF